MDPRQCSISANIKTRHAEQYDGNSKTFQITGSRDYLICLLRNLYAGQEATVRTGHGTTDWFQIETSVVKAVYRHSAYLTYMQSTS